MPWKWCMDGGYALKKLAETSVFCVLLAVGKITNTEDTRGINLDIAPTAAQRWMVMGMAETNFCAFRRFKGDIRMFWCDWKNCKCERFTTCKNPPDIER